MKAIVFNHNNGNVALCNPSQEYIKFLIADNKNYIAIETEEQAVEFIRQKDCPENSYIVDEIELPDSYFFNAWELDINNKPIINMAKARNIQMDKIRKLRNKKLAELDIEQLKGKDVTVPKQILRDIPQTYDLSKFRTPETLKKAIPTEVL